MSCDDTPEGLWKPPSFGPEFQFQFSEKDCGQMFRGQRWSGKTWPALKFIQITVFFKSDFIKFIWTLHVDVKKKCAHSFVQRGQIAHTGRKLCLKMLSATGKKTDICAQKKKKKKTSSGIFLQDGVSFPSILSDIRNWDPAARCWNEKRPGAVLSPRAWALVTIWKRNEWFSGDAWRVSKVGRVHN